VKSSSALAAGFLALMLRRAENLARVHDWFRNKALVCGVKWLKHITLFLCASTFAHYTAATVAVSSNMFDV
jgi:hypothetical protein